MKSAQMSEININDPMNSQDLSLSGREILIADAGVEDLDTLISGLNEGVEAWLVQPGQDAIGLIINAISSPNLKKLHLLAHGAPGEVHLGGSAITASDFRNRFDGAAERDLDIAFWSCHTGAGDVGQGFVQAVADATGARVSATDGLVGNAQKGGNWRLNVSAPFSAEAQNQFKSTLAIIGTLKGPGDVVYSVVDLLLAAEIGGANQTAVITAATVTAADLVTLHTNLSGTGSTANLAAVTSITGSVANLVAAGGYTNFINKSAVPVTVSAGTASAADLNAVSKAFGTVTATAITAITTSTAASIAAFCADTTITKAAGLDATIAAGTISAKDLKAISVSLDVVTFTTVASTTVTGTAAELAALAADTGVITDKDLLLVTVKAGAMTAANVLSIVGMVTVVDNISFENAGAGTTISGTAAQLGSVRTSGYIADGDLLGATMIITGGAGITAVALRTLATGTDHAGVINATAAGTITGTATEVVAVITEGAITGKSALAVTLSAGTVTAANLKTISTAMGVINITAAGPVTGSVADIAIVAADAGITGKSAVAVTVAAGTMTAAQLIAISTGMGNVTIASLGVGTTITGTAAQLAAVDSDTTIIGSGKAGANVVISSGTMSATALTGLSTHFAIVDATNAGVITGTAAQLAALIADAGFGTVDLLGSAALAVSITGSGGITGLALSDLETAVGTVNATAAGTVTGTSAQLAHIADLSTITGKSALAVTLTAGGANASDLKMISTAMGNINASAVGIVTGTAAELKTVLADTTIQSKGGLAVTISSGAMTAVELAALSSGFGQVTATAAGAISGTATQLTSILADTGITGRNGLDVVITGNGGIAATALRTLENQFGTVNVANAGTITGTMADADAIRGNASITNKGLVAVVLTGGAGATAAQLISLEAAVGTVNVAAVGTITGNATDLADVSVNKSITGKAAVAVTLTGGAGATAAQLISISAAMGNINAQSVGSVTSSKAALLATVAADATIQNKGGLAVTIASGELTAGTARAISTAFAQVTVTAANTITGTAAELRDFLADTGITGRGLVDVTVTGSGGVTASALLALDAATSGDVDVASAGTITGTAADLLTAAISTQIINKVSVATTLTTGTGQVTASDLLDIVDGGAGIQFGSVNATAAGTITGTSADMATILASKAITGKGSLAVTLSSGSPSAISLMALSAGMGVINVSSLTALAGTVAQLTTILSDTGITGKTSLAVTINTSGGMTAAALTAISNSFGVVDATNAGPISGSATQLAAILSDASITNGGALDITVTGGGALAASALASLRVQTTGDINLYSASSVTGTADQLLAIANDAAMSHKSAVAVTLTAGGADAADINTISSKMGNVNASSVGVVTGSATELKSILSDTSITGKGSLAVTIGAGAMTTAQLTALSAGFGQVTVNAATGDLSGTAAQLATILADTGITGRGLLDVVITGDAGSTAAALIALEIQVGTVDIAHAGTITGTADDILAIVNNGSFLNTTTDVTLTAGTGVVQAADLIDIDGAMGIINATLAGTISGNPTDLAAILGWNATHITAASKGSLNVTVTGEVGMTAVNLIALTAAFNAVDITNAGVISGSAANMVIILADTSITGKSAVAVDLTAGGANAEDLVALSAGMGDIDVTAAGTIAGTVEDVLLVVDDTHITGKSSSAVTLDAGSMTAAQLLSISVGMGTITITASGAGSTISGNPTELAAVLAANATLICGHSSAVIITGDAGMDATALSDLSTATGYMGVIDATHAGTIAGTAAEVLDVANDADIIGKGALAVVLDAGTVAAADLISVANGMGQVDASAVLLITGKADDVVTVLGDATILHKSGIDVTLSAGDAAAADLISLSSSMGVINAASVTSITGSATDLATVLADTLGITNTGARDAIVTGNLSATQLMALSEGFADVTVTGTVSGSFDDLVTVSADTDIIDNTALTMALTDAEVTAGDLMSLDGATTDMVNVALMTDLEGVIADISSILNSDGISGLGHENISVTDAVSMEDLATLNSATDGTLTYAEVADTATLLAANAGAYLTGVHATDIHTTGNATSDEAEAIFAFGNTGITTVSLENVYHSGSILVGMRVGDTLDLDPNSAADGVEANVVASVDLVDSVGEWFWDDAGTLTWWDDDSSTLDSITLTGVTDITVVVGVVTVV